MIQDETNFVANNKISQLVKTNNQLTTQELQMTDTPDYAWDQIEFDTFGSLNTTELGNNYILALQDLFSKYVIAIPIPDQSEVRS